MLDQDYQTMRQMMTLRSIYNTVQNAPRYTGKKIHDMPANMKRVIAYLQSQGLWRPTVASG
jgi:hypothetical protein